MKSKEIRELTTKELLARLKDEKDHHTRMLLNHAVSAIESSSQIKETRRTIARLKTILRERQIELEKTKLIKE
jgi:large subunit ribosomal protein L29